MTYDPPAYWTRRGPLKRYPHHDAQEAALMKAMGRIQPKSILEVGVGSGRIGKLLMERWPNASYVGLDISETRLAEARENLPERAELVQGDLLDWDYEDLSTYDLVVAAEVLMHVRPDDLPAAVTQLKDWTGRHLYTVDWSEPIDRPAKPHNFRHDYEALGLRKVATVGLQSIYHWRA